MIARCPFAILGLDADHMAACPGYDGELQSFALTSGAGPAVHTCLHLAESRAPDDGFARTCHHPEAELVVPCAARVCRDELTRSRPHVVAAEEAGEIA